MKNNQRGFVPVILLIIVVVAAVGGGAYYVNTKKQNTEKKVDQSITTQLQTQNQPQNQPQTKVQPQTESNNGETSVVILNLDKNTKVSKEQPFNIKWSIKNPPADKENWKINIGMNPGTGDEFGYLQDMKLDSPEGSYTFTEFNEVYKDMSISIQICLTEINRDNRPKVDRYCTTAEGKLVATASKDRAQKVANIKNADLSTWQLYKNKKYGFQFHYPQGWYEDDLIDFEVKGEGMVAIRRCLTDYCEELVSIGVYSKTIDQKVADYTKYWTVDNQKGRFSVEVETFGPENSRLKTIRKEINVTDALTNGSQAEIIYVIADPRNSNRTLVVEINPDNFALPPDEFVATIEKVMGSINFI